MAAPRQKLMKDSATVVATTTFWLENGDGGKALSLEDMYLSILNVFRFGGRLSVPRQVHSTPREWINPI